MAGAGVTDGNLLEVRRRGCRPALGVFFERLNQQAPIAPVRPVQDVDERTDRNLVFNCEDLLAPFAKILLVTRPQVADLD